MINSLQTEYAKEVNQSNQLQIDSTGELSLPLADMKKISIFFLLAMIREKTASLTDDDQKRAAKQAGLAAFEQGISKLLSGGDYKQIAKELKSIDTSGMSESEKADIAIGVDMANKLNALLDEQKKLQQELNTDSSKENEALSKLPQEKTKLFFEHLFGCKDSNETIVAKLRNQDNKVTAKIHDLQDSMSTDVEQFKGKIDASAGKNKTNAEQSMNFDKGLIKDIYSQNYATYF